MGKCVGNKMHILGFPLYSLSKAEFKIYSSGSSMVPGIVTYHLRYIRNTSALVELYFNSNISSILEAKNKS